MIRPDGVERCTARIGEGYALDVVAAGAGTRDK
jgi:hypothetical protein